MTLEFPPMRGEHDPSERYWKLDVKLEPGLSGKTSSAFADRLRAR